MMPRRGKRTRGRRAVANRGMQSLTHQIAMRSATAAMRLAGVFPASTGKTRRRRKETIPNQNPKRLALRPASF
jgi:hypothetical protein